MNQFENSGLYASGAHALSPKLIASPNKKDQKNTQELKELANNVKTYKIPESSSKYFHNEDNRIEPKMLSS